VEKLIYTFGPFRLSPEQGSLTRDGQRVALGQRAFEILLLLVERVDEVVSTADIVTRVWPRTIVDENNLRVHIASLRKVLSDESTRAPYILNVPGRGYRFTATVERHERKTEEARFPADLPAPLTRLVGRDAFVRKMLRELAQFRFVTIVGPGGIGKTRVALAIAHELKGRFVDGCHIVDLTVLTNPHLVLEAVAEALQIPVMSAASLPALANSLRSRHCAIVFDNCEHVIDKAAEVVEAILRAAPNIHILATSREPLRAEGESVHQLTGLEIPPSTPVGATTVREFVMFSAVDLFVERVAAAVDEFCITDSDAPLIAKLCRRLGGNPLAIELAAARIETFGLVGLLDALTDGLSILTKGRRTAPPRHSTLRATLDWSFELLSDTEKAVFGRLGVFVADFTRESVALVVPDEYLDISTVIDALNNLIAKSLVAVSRAEDRIAFRLPDLTRPYARDKLRQDPFACDVYRRHVEYLYALAERSTLEHRANESTPLAPFRLVGGERHGALRSCFSPAGDLDLVSRIPGFRDVAPDK
jgi:predicted ATPase/DNA-binding winged helix-turn-helix (wHTH) protein